MKQLLLFLLGLFSCLHKYESSLPTFEYSIVSFMKMGSRYILFHDLFLSMDHFFSQLRCDIAHASLSAKLQNPSKMKKAQAEIDSVLGQGRPTFELLKKLE
jgi:hypothetical protein